MDRQARIRLAAIERVQRLRDVHDGAVPSRLLEQGITVDGERVAIVSRQQGIHKPRQLSAALTLKTSATNPYADVTEPDSRGLLRYHYRDAGTPTARATAMAKADNASVRRAMAERHPLIYLLGLDKGVYLPMAPVFVVGDDRSAREFALDVTGVGTAALNSPATAATGPAPQPYEPALDRSYAAREVQVRLHQARFRQMVLAAYRSMCAMRRLRHVRMLDAAHLVPDAAGGEPHPSNGMALCKLHHSALDVGVIGIEPETHRVAVREDVLREIDGPMLRHGIQELHGTVVQLPRNAAHRPAAAALEQRWATFRSP